MPSSESQEPLLNPVLQVAYIEGDVKLLVHLKCDSFPYGGER